MENIYTGQCMSDCVAVVIGPPLTTVQYVMHLRFCGCRHFSRNGTNGPESLRCFFSSLPGGGTGSEVTL